MLGHRLDLRDCIAVKEVHENTHIERKRVKIKTNRQRERERGRERETESQQWLRKTLNKGVTGAEILGGMFS